MLQLVLLSTDIHDADSTQKNECSTSIVAVAPNSSDFTSLTPISDDVLGDLDVENLDVNRDIDYPAENNGKVTEELTPLVTSSPIGFTPPILVSATGVLEFHKAPDPTPPIQPEEPLLCNAIPQGQLVEVSQISGGWNQVSEGNEDS